MTTEQALQEKLDALRKLFNRVCQENYKINDLLDFLDRNGYRHPPANWNVLFEQGTLSYNNLGCLVYKAEAEGMTITYWGSDRIEERDDATGEKTYWKQEIRGGCIFYEEA